MLQSYHSYSDFPNFLLTAILFMYVFLNFLIKNYMEYITKCRKENQLYLSTRDIVNILPYLKYFIYIVEVIIYNFVFCFPLHLHYNIKFFCVMKML